MNQVFLEKTSDYSRAEVRDAMVRLLAPLGGMGAFVQPGERVLLKPNMLSAKSPDAAVTTHPEVVRAVIGLVREAGGIPFVGDSPGIGKLQRVAEKCGILQVLADTGTELIEFTEPVQVAGPGLFKRFELARPYLEADRLINLPKLKTHGMMTMTCAVKNLFGAVVGAGKIAWHLRAGEDRDLFARMLLEMYQIRKPDLNIVDAITAMEGDGPSGGDPRPVGLLIAGSNAVSVDVVAAEILGIPKKLLYLERVAAKLALPGVERSSIQVSGCPLDEVRIPDFKLPPLSDVQFGLPRFLSRHIRHYFTAYPFPLPEKCKLCGICRDACPPGAMEIRNGSLEIDYPRCIRCFCCRELCPEHALGVREGKLLQIIKKCI
ncbi:MAG: DUF362 domain-containing protein [Deltaproteobacteria bacterium]|nr:DUF362 domain-containing protein [Deltaproteobacteria bacterium]TLN01144.1 MAG: DUF362 domain-containing protein [bacterium]